MHARRYGRHITYALTVLACALAAPIAATAATTGSGGGGLSGPTGSGATTTTGTTGTDTPVTLPATTAASQPVSVTGDGITLSTISSTLLRRQLTFTGTAPGAAGQTIEIEREGRATDGAWLATVQATVAPDGTFTASWQTDQVGRFSVRAIVLSDAATAAAVPSTVTVSVYRSEKATVYGPGFYGRRTACGTRLTRSTVGVANRTLPCGTKVSIVYDGRELTVPVIDRGPYANDADWDLTTATATALKMPGTENIGTLALPSATGSTSSGTSSTPTPDLEPLG